jgi:hypothetical protein
MADDAAAGETAGTAGGVKARLIEERVDYTGRELRSRWIAGRAGLEGDAIAAFRGACLVTGADLVDLEDFELGNIVAGDDMLHFIVELCGLSLVGITLAQRLLCSITRDVLNEGVGRPAVERRGDDLFLGRGKLSVSVATVSPASGLIHLGLNITTAGVPVEAACLADLGLDHRWVAGEVLGRFAAEVDSVVRASRKVRPVV